MPAGRDGKTRMALISYSFWDFSLPRLPNPSWPSSAAPSSSQRFQHWFWPPPDSQHASLLASIHSDGLSSSLWLSVLSAEVFSALGISSWVDWWKLDLTFFATKPAGSPRFMVFLPVQSPRPVVWILVSRSRQVDMERNALLSGQKPAFPLWGAHF